MGWLDSIFLERAARQRRRGRRLERPAALRGLARVRFLGPSALVFALCVISLFVPRTAQSTVAEQRARLPPAAECQDDVAGVWRSHSFWPDRNQWYLFTLEIRRVEPGSGDLVGVIYSDYWNGTARDQEPPPCSTSGYHYVVRMPATGSAIEGAVAFGGTSWTLERAPCGGTGPRRYYPDRFTGTIDPKIQEFQSVNNDGGPAVNVPMVFRRIRCWDEGAPAPPPAVDVKAPAFGPKRKNDGCRCALPGTPPGGIASGWLLAALLLGCAHARRQRTRAKAEGSHLL